MKDSTRDNIFYGVMMVLFSTWIVTIALVAHFSNQSINEANKQCFPYATFYSNQDKGFVICESPNGRILKQWSKENQEKK